MAAEEGGLGGGCDVGLEFECGKGGRQAFGWWCYMEGYRGECEVVSFGNDQPEGLQVVIFCHGIAGWMLRHRSVG